jgi:hypothetical protein
MKWKIFFVVVLLLASIHASFAKRNRKRKSRNGKVKKQPSTKPPRPPTNCKLGSDGKWTGKGCSEFMVEDEGETQKVWKGSEVANLKRYGIDWLLHPFSRDEYFENYYQRKPLLIQRSKMLNNQNTEDYYGDLWPMSALTKCIDSFKSQRLGTDFVLVKEGFVTPPRFKVIHDSYGAYLEGYTLASFIMNRLWANLGKLVDRLEDDFGFPFRVNVYLTPREAQGFFPHADQHDIFIMQMAGSKHWKVFNNPIPLATRDQELGKHGDPLLEENLGPPLYDVVLKQGDVLYSPRGFIHSARTSNETGSMHLTVRILNAFFFKWGNFFEKALPPTDTGNNNKRGISLPPLKQMQELDLEFRYSTPVKWMDIESKRQQIKLLKQTLCNETEAMAERRNKVRSHCVIQERWVDAFYRAKRKWKKQKSTPSKKKREREKSKIRTWLEEHLMVGQGAKKLRELKQTIDDEHHNLLEKVRGLYPSGLKSFFEKDQYCFAKKGIKVDTEKTMSIDASGSPDFDKSRVILTHQQSRHTFRPELFSVLKQVEGFANSGKPFQVKDLTASPDHFERVSLAHHLRDLKVLDAVEVRPVDKTKKKRKKKKKRR